MILKATTDPRVSQREKKHGDLARAIAQEGIVLLKNEGMLPLKSKKLALYGSGARRTIAGGTGSGAMHPRRYVGIEEGLKNAGADILTGRWLDAYDAHYDEAERTWRARIEEKIAGFTDLYKILGVISHDRFVYPTGIPIGEEDLTDAENAVYVLARQAGEGADRKDVKADYRLDDVEYENLKTLCAHYPNVCVVINVGGMMDLSFLDELPVNAVLFYAQSGQQGGDALADILFGKVSPSGKLTASWPYRLEDVPSTAAFSENGDAKVQNYTEGIYVGYRYFDAFSVAPRYPFGYGLSYAKFAWDASVAVTGGRIVVNCRVKNVGDCAGKEILQLYASLPRGGEVKRLVAFGKTDMIGAGGEDKFTLTLPLTALTYYDETRAAHVLAEGSYLLRLGTSSADTRPVAELVLKEEKVKEQCRNLCGKREKFEELTAPSRTEKVDVPRLTLDLSGCRTVVHDYALPEERRYETLSRMTDGELASLLVGAGTSAAEGPRLVNVMGASGSTASSLYEAYGIPNIVLSDGPAGLNVTPEVVEMADGSLKVTAPYPQYDFGFFGKMMRSRMVVRPEDGVCHYQYATAWPVSLVRAQTWNTALIERMGDAVGREMEEFGVTVWLAPGMNILRNPLCGRTFEYFSEDPVLSGEMAAATVRGVQKHPGKAACLKHFACNNSEFERCYSTSNVSERALREIYLKGFEIAVRKSSPKAVMASYNKLNGVYNTNNGELLNGILRGEWGYAGLVMSDWDAVSEGRGELTLAQKNGCDLVMPGGKQQAEALARALSSGEVSRGDAEKSAARILALISENTAAPAVIK